MAIVVLKYRAINFIWGIRGATGGTRDLRYHIKPSILLSAIKLTNVSLCNFHGKLFIFKINVLQEIRGALISS